MRKIIPLVGTYRLQLNADFTFAHAADITDYLKDIGISHLYLSPIFSSRSKSSHGYDVIDPSQISDERGGTKSFDQLMKITGFQEPPLGVVLDIVPNHMAASNENPYFADVLRMGSHSKFADVFDIYPSKKKRAPLLVLPFLGSRLSDVLNANQLQLSFDVKNGFYFRYFENRFSLSYQSIPKILSRFVDAISHAPYFSKSEITDLNRLSRSFERELVKKKPDYKEALFELYQWFSKGSVRQSQLQEFLSTAPLLFVSDVLKQQHFMLEYWKSGATNYRRFFDVNELIATRIEEESAYEIFSGRLSQLFTKYSSLQGLRVDHIDGLALPEAYLEKLSSISEQIWVEKILAPNEDLPYEWKVLGTTGYDFLNKLSHIFVDEAHFLVLESFHEKQNNAFKDYETCERLSRRQVIDELFKTDYQRLAVDLSIILSKHRVSLEEEEVLVLVREFAVALPRYRSYLQAHRISEEDRQLLQETLHLLRKRVQAPLKPAVDFMAKLSSDFVSWLLRFQQFSGAGLAKGVEDTAFYRYFPLLALNEVGGQAIASADPHGQFHRFLTMRCEHTPLSLNASSTHDTKRSEDARARLLALSWHSAEWLEQVNKWKKANRKHKSQVKGKETPNTATEYFIYQTAASVFPLDGQVNASWMDRVKDYLTKAMREAKLQSNWKDPNALYEKATLQFIERLEYSLMRKFFTQIAEEGAYISLASLSLKTLAPGVPDFYQGCELWDFSLVDPDNRRPVDYELRREVLAEVIKKSKLPRRELIDWLQVTWESGAIKLWLMRELLQLRRGLQTVLEDGDYGALQFKGPRQRELFGFSRQHKGKWVLVVAATNKHLQSLKDNYLLLPKDAPFELWNFLERKTCKSDGRWLDLSEQSTGLPIVLTSDML